ncbi:MAG: Sec-independent protein translocase protein TatB [Psychromonas sp.]
MFDIGFWEIVLISVIGLVVLGPERLPTAIRSVMRWVNTAKGIANSVKTEISQELKLHELNEMNENMIQATKDEFKNLDPKLQESIEEMKKSAQELVNPYQPETKNDAKDEDEDKQHPQRAESKEDVTESTMQQGKKRND